MGGNGGDQAGEDGQGQDGSQEKKSSACQHENGTTLRALRLAQLIFPAKAEISVFSHHALLPFIKRERMRPHAPHVSVFYPTIGADRRKSA